MTRIRAKHGDATAEKGLVILDGPDGVAVSMTSKAARQTGRNLLDASDLADTQKKARDTDNGASNARILGKSSEEDA